MLTTILIALFDHKDLVVNDFAFAEEETSYQILPIFNTQELEKHVQKFRSECVIIVDYTAMDAYEKQLGKLVPVIGYADETEQTDRNEQTQGGLSLLVQSPQAVTLSYLHLAYARFWGEPMVIAETKDLIIREASLSDLDDLYRLYDTLSDCFYVEPLYERTQEEAFQRQYIHHMYGFYQYGLWLVFRKEDGKMIGRAGIENREIDGEVVQELGYLIGKPWQRKGYAYQACQAIMEYAFEELYLEQLYLCTDKTNIPSIALAHKLGFALYSKTTDGMNIYLYEIESK